MRYISLNTLITTQIIRYVLTSIQDIVSLSYTSVAPCTPPHSDARVFDSPMFVTKVGWQFPNWG